MTVSAMSVFGRAGEALGTFIPRLGGALALLLIGLLITGLVDVSGSNAVHAASASGRG